jgi:hypothetical protein
MAGNTSCCQLAFGSRLGATYEWQLLQWAMANSLPDKADGFGAVNEFVFVSLREPHASDKMVIIINAKTELIKECGTWVKFKLSCVGKVIIFGGSRALIFKHFLSMKKREKADSQNENQPFVLSTSLPGKRAGRAMSDSACNEYAYSLLLPSATQRSVHIYY